MPRIVCISDTHDRQRQVEFKENLIPDGDILLHAGDFSMGGRDEETRRFLEWFNSFPHKHKIFICGNHDWIGEKRPQDLEEMLKEFPDITYLNDSGCEAEGLKIWGSPVQPWFCSWAFNRERGADIKKHWDLIPDNCDIIVTHGPVHGLLDEVPGYFSSGQRAGEHVGCTDLLTKVLQVGARLHVCGHIHCARGEKLFQGTHFVNAAMVNESYNWVHEPIVVDL